MPNVTPADAASNVTLGDEMNGVEVNVTPSSEAAPNVTTSTEFNPDAPSVVTVSLGLSAREVAALHHSGFLPDGKTAPYDIEVAVFETLYAVWRTNPRDDVTVPPAAG